MALNPNAAFMKASSINTNSVSNTYKNMSGAKTSNAQMEYQREMEKLKHTSGFT